MDFRAIFRIWHTKKLNRPFHAWQDGFTLLKVRATEVCAFGVLLVFDGDMVREPDFTNIKLSIMTGNTILVHCIWYILEYRTKCYWCDIMMTHVACVCLLTSWDIVAHIGANKLVVVGLGNYLLHDFVRNRIMCNCQSVICLQRPIWYETHVMHSSMIHPLQSTHGHAEFCGIEHSKEDLLYVTLQQEVMTASRDHTWNLKMFIWQKQIQTWNRVTE